MLPEQAAGADKQPGVRFFRGTTNSNSIEKCKHSYRYNSRTRGNAAVVNKQVVIGVKKKGSQLYNTRL